MILVTKGGLSRGDYDMPENCLYDCRLRDTCLYVPRWADEETLLRLGTERSKGCPLKEIFEVPKEAEQTEPQKKCITCEHRYAGHIEVCSACDPYAKTEPNSSEKPNNCEHITEDGVTCAKYPACDDCLDNPLNKVKGSERLVKGSEQTEPTISKMEQVDEPQTDCKDCKYAWWNGEKYECPFEECRYSQTERI